MMTVLTRASNNQPISLGRQIASSGEGEVWETNESGILAKIYHNPTLERIRKLEVMIANAPADPMVSLNHISIAWPKDLLKNQGGASVGFLMPAIRQSKELPSVYNPRLRKRNAPGFNWYYLHATALNTAWIIQAIHAKGYVLGDIKPQNILVNDSALVAVIDTDSFQVRDSQIGKVYRCTVGSEGFTPVELLGKDFSTTDQTEVHDRFRLAVLIHYLLFGYHPFSGQWIGNGESLEQTELIRKGFWPYGQNSLINSSLNTIPFDVVHPELKRCFLKCFNDGHTAPHLRPTAQEWHNTLQLAVNYLIGCSQVNSHHYSRNYGKCYWCERKALLGVDIFPSVSGTATEPTAILKSTLKGHSGSVISIAFSPDGQTLVSASNDKTIKVWKLSTGQELRTLKGHSDYVTSVAISPDGQTLVSASNDKTIKVWKLSTGQELRTLKGHSDYVTSVAISPDGQTLASGSLDKTIKVWKLSTGQELRTLKGHSDYVTSAAISPDGQTLASGSLDKTIKVWKLSTGQELRTLKGHSDRVTSVAISPDGQILASASNDTTIKVWNLSTGQVLCTLKAHSYRVTSVAISPDGQTLVSASNDTTIKVWNLSTQQELRTLKEHSDRVTSVAISPDGQTLASGNADKTIKIWRVSRYPQQSVLQAQPYPSTTSLTTPSQITTPAKNIPLNTTNQPSYNSKKSVSSTTTAPTAATFSKMFAANKTLELVQEHSNPFQVSSVAISLDGQILASGNRDNTIKVWNLKTGKELRTLKGHLNWVNSVTISPDGQTLASGSADKTIKVWNLKTGQELCNLKGHSDYISSVAISPDGQTLASGSGDKTIKVWNLKTGQELRTLKGHSNSVYSVAISPDGQTLASGSKDTTIKVWNLKTGQELRTLKGHSDYVSSVAISPDGQTLASGSADKTIKVWNLKTGQELRTLKGHSNSVYSVAISPDGQTLASGSKDTTIKVWNLSAGQELRTLKVHSDWVTSVAISPDGQTLASASVDKTIKFWG